MLSGHGRGWWPSTRGDYTHFLLYKENKDTADTVGLLAKFLKLVTLHSKICYGSVALCASCFGLLCCSVKASRFMYAGNKDRRAVTVQKMSVYRSV